MIDSISPTAPFKRVYSFPTFKGLEEVPQKIINYLLDFPCVLENGTVYTPPDDNDYPRCRLVKYLYHDTVLPLNEPLPNAQQKKELIFDPLRPADAPNKEKGYRVYPQQYVAQAQVNAQTILRCYIGHTLAKSSYAAEVSIVFEILASTLFESNIASTALSRTLAMEQCIIEALNGVNIDGVGAIYFNARNHSYCGSLPISDRDQNVGRRLTMGFTWMDDGADIDENMVDA